MFDDAPQLSKARLLRITGLFGEYTSLLQGFFAKETYNFKEPTNKRGMNDDTPQLFKAVADA